MASTDENQPNSTPNNSSSDNSGEAPKIKRGVLGGRRTLRRAPTVRPKEGNEATEKKPAAAPKVAPKVAPTVNKSSDANAPSDTTRNNAKSPRTGMRSAPRSGANQQNRQNNNQGSRPQRHNKFNKPSGGRGSRDFNGNRRSSSKYRDNNLSDDDLLREEIEKTREGADTIDIHVLNQKSVPELSNTAKRNGLDTVRARKSELVFSLMRMYSDNGDILYASNGVLEILPDGFGFLRCIESSYLAGPDDVYVSPTQIRRHHLRTGDMISGRIRAPKEDERYFAMLQVEEINYDKPGSLQDKIAFENATPLFPNEMFTLEMGNGTTEDLAPRVVQAFCPIGKGQRGLIVSPPKAGKTMMLQSLAHSISANHPESHLIVLLIDERPEEVTDMKRSVKGEVVASTFDEPATRHVQVAEMVIERAKRLVEHKRDVVILLDSITRLARAYNTVIPSSGKVLTGGVDANALQRPKRILGAARNVEEGGSLTIVATALVDTGSRMDEVIFEEFKGTGNMEVHLDRRIAEKRIFPAININRSGTRREELMMTPEELRRTWIIRKVLHPMDELAASEFLLERLHQVKTNAEFFEMMKD